MKPRIILLFISLLCFYLPSRGQHKLFHSYSMSDGLTNNAVRNIYQDSQGFIWIGTWEGLSKFEGNRFTPFTTKNGLPHSMINDVIEISPGVILVTMNDGSISYIRNGRLDRQSRKSNFVINKVLNDPRQGLIGATDSYGLVRIGTDKVTKVSPGDNYSTYDIIKWKDYFITIGDPAPVFIYDQQLKMKGKSSNTGSFQHCIYKDHRDQLFVGIASGIMIADITDPLNPVLKRAPAPFDHPSLTNVPVTAIYHDEEGNYWFGTHNGLVKVSPAGVTQVFTERDGLPGNRIACITGDKEKNLWIGTYSGLAKLPYQSLDALIPTNGLFYKTPLNGVLRLNDDHLAIVASDAVYQYDLKKGSLQSILNMRPGTSAVPVTGKGPFTVIHNGMVYSWNEQQQGLEPKRRFHNNFYFSAASYEGMICAASGGITLQFEDGTIMRIMDSVRIQTVTWDARGRILAGGWNQAIYRVSVDKKAKRVTEIEDLSYIPKLTFIRSIYTDRDGNIWAGTRYNGIFVLTEKAKGEFQVYPIGLSKGLQSEWVHFITQAPDGNMWVGTLAGISKIITTNRSYHVFNFSNAIDFYSTVNWLTVTGQDQFWGTSDNGVFGFRDLKLEHTAALPVYFTSIRLGNADTNFIPDKNGKKVRLRYNQNYVRLDFASPSFLNEKDIYYSYRLRGSRDTSWTVPGKNPSVEFASLSPGHYVFEVKMKGWNGEFGPLSAFAFSINRPVWQSTWFYLAIALLIMLGAYLLVRYRTQQLLKLQSVRNAIATDLHDDIGSSLTNISILSQLSLDSIERKEETKEFISRIRDEVQSSNQALDDIIWSVNSRNDTTDETLARMRRYVGDVFDNSTTKCHLELVSNGTDLKLHMEQRRDLFLIFKEALNNIYKHASASNTWIQVNVSPQLIRLSIKDDGTGFDPAAPTHRNGLKNMRSRVEKWKGQFQVNARPLAGTQLEITMPVAHK